MSDTTTILTQTELVSPDGTEFVLVCTAGGVWKKVKLSNLPGGGGGGGGDTTPPTVVSATVANATPTVINIVFSEAVTGVSATGWSFKKNGVSWAISSVSGSGTAWNFTMTGAAANGDTLLRSYNSATGATIDASSNELVSFTDSSVTNSVSGSGTLEDLIFSTAHGLSVAGTTWDGSLATSAQYDNYGVATKSIASGQDGYIRAKYTDANGDSAIIAIDTDNTDERLVPGSSIAPTFNYKAGAYVYAGTLYYFEESVAVTSTGVTLSAGHYWGISRTGSVWKVQKSTDGTTWTDAVTLAYTGTGQIYLKANVDNFNNANSRLYEPKGFNVS